MLPSQIMAQVAQEVYDTPTGKHPWIPQGSRLVGRYSSDIAYGQARVLVAWQRIVFPDGKAIDAYLGTCQDASYYRGSPRFRHGGCTDVEWAAIKDNHRLGSEAQKRATDALFRGLDKQQAALEADARTLQRLQASAQSATRQMPAISYANQLARQEPTNCCRFAPCW